MSKKYNSKKQLKQGVLGNVLKTDFSGFQKPELKYSTVDCNWRERAEEQGQEENNFDLLINAFFGDKKRVKIALTSSNNNEGADINVVDKHKNNALILAVYSRKEEVVKYLANYNKDNKGNVLPDIDKIDLDWTNADGLSALTLAVKLKNHLIARILLEAGANPNVLGAYKETPIFHAVRENDVKMIELLQSYGANIDQKNREGQTPLIVASQNRDRQEALLSLIKGGAEFSVDYAGKSPLMHAANNSNGVMMDILLKASGYSKEFMDMQDKKGVSTLMICCKRGNREATRVLLARGADPFLEDDNKRAAIAYAEFYKNPTCFEITQKVMKIYGKANEMEQAQREKFLSTELEKIGYQNRVANSCCK